MSKSFPSVGVIGAGQLARMMVAPAAALGIDLLLLAQSPADSAALIASHVVGDYKDLDTVRNFAKKCDVVTFEHELIPISIIKALESDGVVVRPSSDAFLFSQDKAAMRKKLNSFPSPKWEVISTPETKIPFPLIAKRISGGYDGRGVWKVSSNDELKELLKVNEVLLVEELITFDYEIAVMVARSSHGEVATWAPTQTIQSDGICTMTITPAPALTDALSASAAKLAIDVARELEVIGVMAVEMFVKGDQLFINELAMRPHNSGHWTIEGAITSQFEQHLRVILDLPLGDTSMRAPFAVMGNLLGGTERDWYSSYSHLMARNPQLKFHRYRKEVRTGRKIGHVNIIGEDLVELTQVIQHARSYMSGEIDE